MKRFLLAALIACAFVAPVIAEDAPKADAPKADAAVAAPAAAPAAALVKLEGTVVMKDKDAFIKTADAELALLPCDKLTELLKVEKVAEKTFVLEGEKVAAKDGKSEGFMIKNFEEKKADAAAPAAEPKKEEKK